MLRSREMQSELAGYRVLVVEDEYFLAAEIEDALTEAGAEVIGTLAQALEQVKRDAFDVVILDINLRGETSFPIADALAERSMPFSSRVRLRHLSFPSDTVDGLSFKSLMPCGRS